MSRFKNFCWMTHQWGFLTLPGFFYSPCCLFNTFIWMTDDDEVLSQSHSFYKHLVAGLFMLGSSLEMTRQLATTILRVALCFIWFLLWGVVVSELRSRCYKNLRMEACKYFMDVRFGLWLWICYSISNCYSLVFLRGKSSACSNSLRKCTTNIFFLF